MKILRISRSFYPLRGGQENHILSLSERLISHGVATTVVTLPVNSQAPQNETYKGVKIVRPRVSFEYGLMTRIRLYAFIVKAIFASFRLKKDGQKFDLIIGHDFWSGIAGIVVARFIFKTPFIYFAHGIFQNVLGRFGKFVERIYLKYLPKDFLLCVDDGTGGDDFILKKLKFDKKKFKFVPHGIDVNLFKPSLSLKKEELRKRFDFPKDSFIVLNTAKINSYKGSLNIARGFVNFKKAYPKKDIVLVFANEPYDAQKDEYNKILFLMKREGMNDSLIFTGNIPHEKVPDLLNAADVWVSMASYSNAGNALLEAMACELPVIVSDTGATSKTVKDSVNGFVIPDKGIEQLTNALKIIFENPNKVTIIKKSARDFIVQKNSWEKRIEQEISVYYSLIP